MNRRSFLKLFGLLAVPSSVLALPKVEPRKGMIVITVELSKQSPYEKVKVDTGYHNSEWMNFCPTTWNNLASSNAFFCGVDKEITISFSNGSSVSFEIGEEEWNEDFNEFESIRIVKNKDMIEFMDFV